jgi:hypothetical protein
MLINGWRLSVMVEHVRVVINGVDSIPLLEDHDHALII